jgi:drug/metabolite transporter (DMT)-like permease
MIAVLGGLGAAACWALTGILGQRTSRAIGELSAYAWAALAGLILTAAPAAIALAGDPVSATTLVQLALAGVLNVIGLVAQFAALARGRVSMVIPISSAEGAVAAVAAAVAGAHLGGTGWLALGVVMAGVAITAAGAESEAGDGGGSPWPGVGLAVVSAVSFGIGLFLQGHAGGHVPLGLAIAPPSAMGALLVTAPLGANRRLRAPGGQWLSLVGIAVAELGGFLAYVIGARHSVPVAAVLSSQYATIAVIVGVLLLGDRPRRWQWVGYVAIIAGVTVLSARA